MTDPRDNDTQEPPDSDAETDYMRKFEACQNLWTALHEFRRDPGNETLFGNLRRRYRLLSQFRDYDLDRIGEIGAVIDDIASNRMGGPHPQDSTLRDVQGTLGDLYRRLRRDGVAFPEARDCIVMLATIPVPAD